MEIDSTENKKLIIDQQNKLIEFLYKQEEQYVEKLNEHKENKEEIFNRIGELANYIEDADYIEKEYILEELASIQSIL